MEPIDRYVQQVIVSILEAGLTPSAPGPIRSSDKVHQLRDRIAETQRLFAEDDSLTPLQYQDVMRTLNRRLAEEERALLQESGPVLAGNVMGPAAREAWAELDLTTKRQVINELAEVRLHRALPGRRGFDPDTVELIPKL